MRPIYLAHAATTPLDPRVREAMLPWLSEEFANPSSLHEGGRRARMEIDEAREKVAALLGCLPAEVVFTSSGTEAANLAILGIALAERAAPASSRHSRMLFGASEHHCVLHTRDILETIGFIVDVIPASAGGVIRPDKVRQGLRDDVLLVSVMHANNETGVINDVAGISQMCGNNGVLFHCDAVQTYGLLPVPAGADFVSISAHKIYGPKGTGALFVRAGVKPKPIAVGGAQERELRAGTENVPAIVGFGVAAEIAASEMPARAEAVSRVRDEFERKVAELLPQAIFTVPADLPRLPGHSHLRIPGAGAEAMLINLDRLGVAASSGAACSSGSIEPSHVLLASAHSESEAKEGLRFSFGKDNTAEDAIEAAKRLQQAAEQITAARR